MKKTLSFILCFLFLISMFTFSSFAVEENSGFLASSMEITGYGRYFQNGNAVDVDLSDRITVYDNVINNIDCTGFMFLSVGQPYSYVFTQLYEITDINSSHEYNLHFYWDCIVKDKGLFDVSLNFYDANGNLIKEQIIYNHTEFITDLTEVNIDFKPDVTGLGGYKCKLEFTFMTLSSVGDTLFLSDFIEFVDKDDNISWFQKIINAIKELPSNFINGIRNFFEDLSSKLTDLKDRIVSSLTDLKDRIVSSLTDLKDRIVSSLTDLGNNIIDGLKTLFIPSSDYFSNAFNDLMDYFETKFGLFALPFTLIINILELYKNIGEGSGELFLLPFEINGEVLWRSSIINIKELIMNFNSVFVSKFGINLYQVYLSFVDVVIIIGFSRLIKRKYNSMFDTGYFDPPETIYKGDSN